MTHKTEKLAVMFADICGSTALYDSLGDDLARRLITKCIVVMMGKVSVHQGTLIKTIGDEIMCTFPSVELAMLAACDMQSTIENDNHGNEHPMHIRIGFHYGEVICEPGDVYGDTVNIAARVASISRAGQIVTTKAAAGLLPPDMRDQTYQIMRAELKGKQEQLDIFQVTWGGDSTMRVRIGNFAFRKPQEGNGELTLRYHDQLLKVNEQKKSVVLGREEVCDILILSDSASRQHARIELRFGKFVIVDQSTNGTYFRFADGHSARLLREDRILHGSGAICLGQPCPEDTRDAVEFSIAPVRS